jgi:putative flippase GtrA
MRIFRLDEKRYIKYAIVALIVTAVDYATFIFAYYFTNVVIAQFLAYLVAILLSFKLHGNFVFGVYRKTHVALTGVIFFSLIGLMVSNLMLYAYIFLTKNVYVAKIILTLTMFIYNFYSKKFVYGNRGPSVEG